MSSTASPTASCASTAPARCASRSTSTPTISFKLPQSSGSPADVYGPFPFAANGGISAAFISPPIILNLNSALRVTTDITGDHCIYVGAKVA